MVFSLQLREILRKLQPENLIHPEIEPESGAWEVTTLPLGHNSGRRSFVRYRMILIELKILNYIMLYKMDVTLKETLQMEKIESFYLVIR